MNLKATSINRRTRLSSNIHLSGETGVPRFIHPITILSGLPAAGLGALLALLLFGEDLNLYSFVGIILLIGIVKKNAIMMIDFALAAERNEGKSPEEAIFEGCMQRLRPIMMTTMAALLGTLPIAFGTGAGGHWELRWSAGWWCRNS